MENNAFKLYTMNIKELSDEAYYKKCYDSLSDYRKEKIDKCRFLEDKKRAMGAGLLLNKGLEEYGLREMEVRIAQGEHGKPSLLDYPGIHFNLSHSGDMVLAVFAKTEVGCDIEQIRPANLNLAKRFFCPYEYSYIASLESEEQNQAFCRIWTLKESFLKITGMGIRLPLNSFEFDITKGCLGIMIRQEFDENLYDFWEYDFGIYHAAVCMQV